jgi:predicted phosphodiesterase
MIFVTGDVHGNHDISKLNSDNFDVTELTKDDFVIVAGDFGLVWNNSKRDQYWLKWLDKKPFTTLFVDGNHENHEMLDNMPVVEWNGGKVHFINNSVIHLMRGQVFELEGLNFFTFGGADSIDKLYRVENISWWKREMPSVVEYEEGLANLERCNNIVDYVITHTCPLKIFNQLATYKESTVLENYFDQIEQQIVFKHWFFGHYHISQKIEDKFTALYNEIIRIV